MKNVLFTGRRHVTTIMGNLFLLACVSLNLWFHSPSVEAASLFCLVLATLGGSAEALSFIRRTTSWEAFNLVPGYLKKIWITSLQIVSVYLAYGLVLLLALETSIPPIGFAAMVALSLLALQIYRFRTGSKVASYSVTIFICVIVSVSLAILLAPYYYEKSDLLDPVWATLSSPLVQLLAFTLAVFAALTCKTQIEETVSTSKRVATNDWNRFYVNVAGRFRFGGWPHPSAHFLPTFLYIAPIFVIVGVSYVSFADEGTSILRNNAAHFSVVTAIIIYIGCGTPFGLLKNPGMWLGIAWRLGLGNSRRSIGREFALGISKACLGPGLAVVCVALIHGFSVESPSADWMGYANFYDETLLLFCVYLLGFTWGCASFPTRSMECPEFLLIRIVVCVAACFVFFPGIDFGLTGRVLLCLAVIACFVLAINLGGRMVAEIDFLPLRKQLDPLTD